MATSYEDWYSEKLANAIMARLGPHFHKLEQAMSSVNDSVTVLASDVQALTASVTATVAALNDLKAQLSQESLSPESKDALAAADASVKQMVSDLNSAVNPPAPEPTPTPEPTPAP